MAFFTYIVKFSAFKLISFMAYTCKELDLGVSQDVLQDVSQDMSQDVS